MQQGRCTNYDGDHVMFTASYNKGYDTYIWNGSGHTIGNGFSRTAEPDFDHYDGGLMGYEIDGKKGVILVAGQFEYFGTTEWWDPEWQEWSMVSRNNAHNWLYGFTTISISGTPYFFGGKIFAEEFVTDVWMMGRNWQWTMHPQKLLNTRLFHMSILTKGHVIHFGGFDMDHPEAWEILDDGNFKITELTDYTSPNWRHFPMMMEVSPDDF
jgi:hypothetical protein